MTTPYPLGRKVKHDPRSWNYRVAQPSSPTRVTVRWERALPALDQGDVGSCTGQAGTGVLATAPFVSTMPAGTTLDEHYATQLYSDATKIDDAPGTWPPTDTGSDGLSIAKVLKTRGLISGYQHAFGINDAFTAIQAGPLMVGTVWTHGMFSPDANGIITPTGPIAGGHEYECIGYNTGTDLWEFVNSWGAGWGKVGHFFMSTTTFDKLLKQQGDIVLLTPTTQQAPAPAPVHDSTAAARAYLDAWANTRHTGTNAKAAAAWKTVRAA